MVFGFGKKVKVGAGQKSDRGNPGKQLTTAEKEQKDMQYRRENKSRWSNPFWESQAVKVIKEKIEHYKATGNERKLAIYKAKLKGKHGVKRASSRHITA